MATSIQWTDAIGAATLTNGLQVPADRFRSWTPWARTRGARATALSTGRLYHFREGQPRHGVTFQLHYIPETKMELVLRLLEHLQEAGEVTVNTGDAANRSYVCQLDMLASGNYEDTGDGAAEFEFMDSRTLEYKLTLRLIAPDETRHLVCTYDVAGVES